MSSNAKSGMIETLKDGRSVAIRPIKPDDKKLLLEAFRRLDDDTIRQRFFGSKKELTEQELALATEINFVRNVALVACVQGPKERIVAVGRYIASDAQIKSSTAEVAFVVEKEYRGQGLASLLLKHLVLVAREQGICTFTAEVLPGNWPLLPVAG